VTVVATPNRTRKHRLATSWRDLEIERSEAPGGPTSQKQVRAGQTAEFDNGQEHRHNFEAYKEGYGHVMLLDISRLIRPVSIGPGIMKTGTDGLPLNRGIRNARRDGATVLWCHNKFGVEAVIFDFAYEQSALYGVIAILIALMAGWLAHIAFRRA